MPPFANARSDRRRTLKFAAMALFAPALLLSRREAAASNRRALAFVHTHTGERLDIVYAEHGDYVPDALASIDRLLRDHRTGDIHAIDPALLDQLAALATSTGTRRPYEVICGYRCPATNAMLRERGHDVARASLHLSGQAIDLRLSDIPLATLRDAALSLAAGGVGYYPGSNFVHLDSGRIRRW